MNTYKVVYSNGCAAQRISEVVKKQNTEYIEVLKEIVDILNRLDNQRWFAALVERDLQLANHVSDLLSKAEKLVAGKLNQ